jgi:hypothetical protein
MFGLGIAEVGHIVATAVAEIDPTDEGDVRVRVVRPVDHDELLMVRAGAPDTLVEYDRAAGRGYDPGELRLFLLVEAEALGMGAPEETADVDASPGERGEHGRERGAGVGQLLVVVTAPIGQAEEVTGGERLQLGGESCEVRVAVDERFDVIAIRPWLLPNERSALEPSFALVEEPRMEQLRHR